MIWPLSELLQDSGKKQDMDYLFPEEELSQGQWVGWSLRKQSRCVPWALEEVPADQLKVTAPAVL